MNKLNTTRNYAITGMHLGSNRRSQFLLASMLLRLKIYNILGYNSTRVYEAEVRIGELRHSLFLRAQDIFICHEVLGNLPYILPDLYKKPPRLIVDLGAHIGLATLQFKSTFPEAIIHCYESDPENFNLLELNITGLSNVILHNEGVGDKLGASTLYVHRSRHSSTSLNRPHDYKDVYEIQCTVKPLDTIIHELKDTIDLIKFDIEGIEYQAFSR